MTPTVMKHKDTEYSLRFGPHCQQCSTRCGLYCYRWPVRVLITTVNPAKTAEQTKMPFVGQNRVVRGTIYWMGLHGHHLANTIGRSVLGSCHRLSLL